MHNAAEPTGDGENTEQATKIDTTIADKRAPE